MKNPNSAHLAGSLAILSTIPRCSHQKTNRNRSLRPASASARWNRLVCAPVASVRYGRSQIGPVAVNGSKGRSSTASNKGVGTPPRTPPRRSPTSKRTPYDGLPSPSLPIPAPVRWTSKSVAPHPHSRTMDFQVRRSPSPLSYDGLPSPSLPIPAPVRWTSKSVASYPRPRTMDFQVRRSPSPLSPSLSTSPKKSTSHGLSLDSLMSRRTSDEAVARPSASRCPNEA